MDKIGLVDCNNFYVSCERLFRPDLAKRPVVVLSSNDGCVVARSQEIKDKGIAMGVPYFQIKDILSDMKAEVFSSHFALYRDISKRVFNILRSRLGEVDEYSIDECFFNVNISDAEALSLELRDLVKRQVGIPVSVGVAQSKTQAKFANRLAKKTNGRFVLTIDEWQKRTTTINLGEIWGVGEGRLRQFANYKLVTVADYLQQSVSEVGSRFGLPGVELYAELNGQSSDHIQSSSSTRKTITNSRSFAKESKDKKIILGALLYHLHELIRELAETKTTATKIKILLIPGRFGDFSLQNTIAEDILTLPSRDIFTLTEIVTRLFEKYFRAGIPYKKVGIVATVVSDEGLTTSLFPKQEATANLTEVLLDLNKRFNQKALRLGNLTMTEGRRSTLSAEQFISPNYTTQWSELKIIKA